jgi:hypothetical protein
MELQILDVTPNHPKETNDVVIVHEIFVRVGNNKFIIKNHNTGQYFFERRVRIYTIDNENNQTLLKNVSV